jgi:hypothetical protein
MELTTEVVRELLDYDKETGIFTWKARERSWFKTERTYKMWNTRFAGRVTGTMWRGATGYPQIVIKVFGKHHGAHRLAFLWMGEALPEQADHLNRDSLDNRWCNLAASSARANNKNSSMCRNNTSGVTGVTWDKANNKWKAQVKLNGKQNNLGRFEELAEAFDAVKAFRAENGFSSGHGKKHAKYIKKPVDSVI